MRIKFRPETVDEWMQSSIVFPAEGRTDPPRLLWLRRLPACRGGDFLTDVALAYNRPHASRPKERMWDKASCI